MIDTPDSSLKSNNKKKASLDNIISWRNFLRSLIYLMLVSLGGGLSYSWYFLTEEALPTTEKFLGKYLSRPIELGEVEAISFTSVRLGKSTLPTTQEENDYVVAESVDISINPWQLFNQRVELTIDINDAEVLLQQDEKKGWLKLKLNRGRKREGWKVRVKEIRVNDSELTVRNNSNQKGNKNNKDESLIAKVTVGFGNIIFDPQQFTFNIGGDIADGGKLKGGGYYQPQQKKWFIKINPEDVDIDIVTQIVRLPVNIDSGQATGDFAFSFIKSKLDLSSLAGELEFGGVNLNIPQLPQNLTDSKGIIKFHDRNITLTDVNSNFGSINANAQGVITDFKTLDIQAQNTDAVTIDQVWTSLKLAKNNLKKEGKVKAKLNVNGKIRNPILTAYIVNDGQLTIDKIAIDQADAKLSIVNRKLNLDNVKLSPKIGGEISATGEVNFDRTVTC